MYMCIKTPDQYLREQPTWTSETLVLGQAAPQGRNAELRPSVPAPFLGAPVASALVQRSGHTRSGCGQFHAAVCRVCRGTCQHTLLYQSIVPWLQV